MNRDNSRANDLARVEAALLADDLQGAESLLRALRWAEPDHLPALQFDALLKLLRGDSAGGLRAFERQAAKHGAQGDATLWLTVARQYANRPFSAANFRTQLVVERLRGSRYMDYPAEVHLETFTKCNAACSFCPYPTLDRLGTRMSDALIDKILGDLEAIPADLPFGIAPFKVNEPLLDVRLFDICAAINRRLPNAHPRIFTNGAPLTDTMIDRLARIERLQHLWISLNECDPVRYESVMGIPLARTLVAMERLHAAVEDGRFPHPVIVSRVRDRTDEDRRFETFMATRFPRFGVVLMPYAAWAGQIESPEDTPPPPTGCSRWFELSIMSTGRVALCCMDGEGRHMIGDVAADNALAVYNAPGYRRLREASLDRLVAGAPCATCSL